MGGNNFNFGLGVDGGLEEDEEGSELFPAQSDSPIDGFGDPNLFFAPDRESLLLQQAKALDATKAQRSSAIEDLYASQTRLSPEEVGVTALTTLLPILIGAGLHGKKGLGYGARSAAVGGGTYLKGLALEDEQEKKKALLQAQALKEREGALTKQVSQNQEQMMREKALNERQNKSFENQKTIAGIYASKNGDDKSWGDPLIEKAFLRLSQGKEDEITTEEMAAVIKSPKAFKAFKEWKYVDFREEGLSQADRRLRGEGQKSLADKKLPSRFSLTKDGRILDDEQRKSVIEASEARDLAVRSIDTVSDVFKRRGLYESILKSGTPEQKKKLGEDLQKVRLAVDAIRSGFVSGNPAYKGVLSNQDLERLDLLLPPQIVDESDVSQFFTNLRKAGDVEIGKLAASKAEISTRYSSLLNRLDVNDNLISPTSPISLARELPPINKVGEAKIDLLNGMSRSQFSQIIADIEDGSIIKLLVPKTPDNPTGIKEVVRDSTSPKGYR